jgi:hypothetical protein
MTTAKKHTRLTLTDNSTEVIKITDLKSMLYIMEKKGGCSKATINKIRKQIDSLERET